MRSIIGDFNRNGGQVDHSESSIVGNSITQKISRKNVKKLSETINPHRSGRATSRYYNPRFDEEETINHETLVPADTIINGPLPYDPIFENSDFWTQKILEIVQKTDRKMFQRTQGRDFPFFDNEKYYDI